MFSTINVTLGELLKMQADLNSAYFTGLNFKTLYGIKRNKQNIEKVIRPFQEIEEEKRLQTKEYADKRMELVLKYSEKDEAGMPRAYGQNIFKIPDADKSQFDAEEAALQAEYADQYSMSKTIEDDIKRAIKENVTVEIYKLKMSDLENASGLSSKEVDALYPFIDHEDGVNDVEQKIA